MFDLIFSIPWWLTTLVCGTGVVLFLTANARQENRLRNIGAAIFCLGLLASIISFLVETDKEKVERHTHELVTAIVQSNWPVVQSLLDPQIAFTKLRGIPETVHSLQLAQDTVHVKSVHIVHSRIEQLPDRISESIDVYTTQEATLDEPLMSGWRLDWAPTPDGRDWKLAKVECLGAGQITAEQIEAHIPGAR